MQNSLRALKVHSVSERTLSKTIKKLNTLLAWFALLMSFNNLLVAGTNVSIFLFLYITFIAVFHYKVLGFNTIPQWGALIFALGAIASVLDINANGYDAFERSMAVLPNFIYWSFMIIIYSNLAPVIGFLQQDNLVRLAKYIMIGVFLCLVFYELKSVLSFAFIKRNTPNSYAFVLVCYSAISMVYLRMKYGRNTTILGLLIILTSLLLLERRAGFILVALSSILALNFEKLSVKTFISIAILGFTGLLLLKLDFVENSLKQASPRIHEVIYEAKNISTTDQSYLTRVAMIEKGKEIFKEHALNGIGLNNFSNHYVNIPGMFIGSELVMQKELNDKSGHNSYIVLLAEGGLLVFIPFILLLIYNLFHFVKDFRQRTRLESAFYWSFVAMCIHIYFISEILNVFAWFLIAMVTSISLKYTSKPKLKSAGI